VDKAENSIKKLPILSAKSDYIFKLIFGDEKNKEVLISFLKSVLELPNEEYESLELVDPNIKKTTRKGKFSILDIKVKTTSGKFLDIEIQLLNHEGLRERIVYYTSRMICDQMKSGDDYAVIKRAISIVITDFILIKENDKYHNRFRLYNPEANTEFSDILEINTLELEKLPSEPDKKSDKNKWLWLKFLNADDEEELKMIEQALPEIKQAGNILRKLSQSGKVRAGYEAWHKALSDEVTRINSARREGIKEGSREGEKKRNVAIAKEMLKDGLSIDMVCKFTKLSLKEIEQLK
jgi:predicted transposase/invertase (TIGR01784 family)